MADELNTAGTGTRVEFSAEQQVKVNELIQQAQGKAAKDLRTELDATKTQLTTLQSDLVAAKEAVLKAKTSADRGDANADVVALKAQIDEMKNTHKTVQDELVTWKKEASAKAAEVVSANTVTLNLKKQYAITSAASKRELGFVDVGVVEKLTHDLVQWDTELGQFVGLNDAGHTKLNSAMEPMTLDEFYADFASKNKFLVRSDVQFGAGGTEGSRSEVGGTRYEVKDIFGRGSNATLANELKLKNPQEYSRMKQQARKLGLIG